jgi:flagellar hook-basal body complex protein FliE
MFIVPIQPMQPMTFSEKNVTAKPAALGDSFQHVLSNAMAALEDTQSSSQQDAYQLALGDVDDIGQVMINMLKAESMVQTTVQITSRVISAYKEIMQIQV